MVGRVSCETTCVSKVGTDDSLSWLVNSVVLPTPVQLGHQLRDSRKVDQYSRFDTGKDLDSGPAHYGAQLT